jgi:hypothetical protein
VGEDIGVVIGTVITPAAGVERDVRVRGVHYAVSADLVGANDHGGWEAIVKIVNEKDALFAPSTNKNTAPDSAKERSAPASTVVGPSQWTRRVGACG